jgi:DNA-binding transcriptional ArsR family regulator
VGRCNEPQRTQVQALLVVNRRRRVAELYLTGAITEAGIAAQLQVSQPTVSRDLAAIRAEWRTEYRESIEEAVQRDLKNIDLAYLALVLARNLGTLDEAEFGRVAIGIVMKRRQKLLGTEAPERVEVYGKVEQPVTVENAGQLSIDQLEAMLQKNHRRGRTNGSGRGSRRA